MSLTLRPQEFPDFMEQWERPMYVSNSVLDKLYRAALWHEENTEALLPVPPPSSMYDPDVEVAGFDKHLDTAEKQYRAYAERLGT
jgi:RNA-dependent RNA polymerase